MNCMTGDLRLPLFLVFEGIDGAGKSTLRDSVASMLSDNGYPVIMLKEPTDGQWGMKIREMMQGKLLPDLGEQLNLFLLDRGEDVTDNIYPALLQGKIILMDRYYFSNIAYQGAMGMSPASIEAINMRGNFPRPDRVYFIDITPEEAIKRITARGVAAGQESDCFETIEFLTKVRKIFIEYSDDSFLCLDGSQAPSLLVETVLNDIMTRFKKQ